jgi:hypothetical protein
MPPRLQNCFWRFLDHAMPDGPPVFLIFVVVSLVILNGFIVFFAVIDSRAPNRHGRVSQSR